MPNGELAPMPQIDETAPNAAALLWQANAIALIYHGLGELKASVDTLSIWQRGRETDMAKDAAREELLDEMEQKSQRRWQAAHLKIQMGTALFGIGAGLGAVLVRLLG